jgi:hypothetical protein
MDVPEAAMDQHDLSMPRKDDIWSSRKVATMQSEAETQPMDE